MEEKKGLWNVLGTIAFIISGAFLFKAAFSLLRGLRKK